MISPISQNLLGKVYGGLAGQDIRAIWQEYEDSETLDSLFVHDLDKMELLLQMVEYEKRAKKTLDLGEFAYVATRVVLPEIKECVTPMHRFMGAFEQKQEAPDRNYQYLVIAAEPYETIAFKLQSREIDRRDTGLVTSSAPGTRPRPEPSTWSHYDPDGKTFSIQVMFK